jgi:dTDP-4-amino-4,6-dideoxygalactose transaminase
MRLGGIPKFADIDPETLQVSAESIESLIGEKTRGIIAVNLFGQCAPYEKIRECAQTNGLWLIEDSAQAFGATQCGQNACTFGDISITSFYPAKPLGCYGDGGAVFTDNDEWAELIASYRVHGKGSFKYDNIRIGLNSRLDTLQAAILQVKLKAFKDYELEAVNTAAERYTSLLRGIVETPVIPDGFGSSWAQYTIRLKDKETRDKLQASLKASGIPAMVYYPKPMHLQTAFAGIDARRCLTAASLCDRVLSIPMHPYLTAEDINTVCNAVIETIR